MNKYDKLSKERKELQAQGLVPEWYTTGGYQMFKEKYEHDTQGRSVKAQYERIARTASKHLKGTKYEAQAYDKFFNLFWKGWLSASSPVLGNTGTNKGLPVSCGGSDIQDNIEGFYNNLRETAVLTKHGFGTSSNLSKIRPRGSKVSIGGKANGVIPVIKEHVQSMRNVSQGQSRRGAWAGYLDIEHGDFWELADLLKNEPDDLNIGWTIKDSFIAKLEAGDAEAISRFKRVLFVKMLTGKGYFFFVDKANRKSPQVYKDLGLEINNSNLCVAPETLIYTDKGHLPIASLKDQKVNVWNGEEFSEVTVRQTGSNQKLIKVVTDSATVECTPEHKFFVQKGSKQVETKAKDLVVGDKLIKCNFEVIEGNLVLDNAYENGLYTAEGFFYKGEQCTYLYHAKQDLLPYLNNSIYTKIYTDVNGKRILLKTKELKEKFFVPDASYTIESRLKWLEGVLDGDGTVARNGKTQSIQLGTIEKDFANKVRLMLQTLGIDTRINLAVKEGYRDLPLNDGSGKLGSFFCQESYRVLINQEGICRLLALGFNPKRLSLTDHKPNRDAKHFNKVVAIQDENRYDDTYCFTEPKRNKGVFNGILTGNCNEIMLMNDEDHSFSCVLSSMNVSLWHEWKDTDAVFWATIFLDCIAEEFIQKAKDIPALEKTVRFTQKSRALGLGQAGLATLFQQDGLAFEGFEAHMLSNTIASHIHDESLRASKDMAKELGEPEWLVGYGLRNTHRIAIAPTKTSSLIMGGISEGINPDPSMTFTQTTSAGEIDRVNPTLLKVMKDKGVYTKKHIQEIVDAQGSVQGVSWLTDDEKLVFRTAFEMNMHNILRLASSRARFIDQWQSLNLFFSADEKPEVIAKVHKEAFLDEDILGAYYIYTQAGVQASKESECLACQ